MLSLDVMQLIQIFLLSKINPSPNLSHTARSFTKLNFAFSLPIFLSAQLPLLLPREDGHEQRGRYELLGRGGQTHERRRHDDGLMPQHPAHGLFDADFRRDALQDMARSFTRLVGSVVRRKVY